MCRIRSCGGLIKTIARLWEEYMLSNVDESSDCSDAELDSEVTEAGVIPVPDSVRDTEGSEGDVNEFNMLKTNMDTAIERAVALQCKLNGGEPCCSLFSLE